MATDTEMTAGEVARQLILIAIDSLHAMLKVYMGEVAIKNVAKYGVIAGGLRTALLTAVMEAIFAGVKAAVSSVSQRYAGKYDVIGQDDGRLYTGVPFGGTPRTGIVGRPTLYAERGDELVVDNRTLRNVRLNFPDVLPKIRASMVPQMAQGNVAQRLTDNRQPEAGNSATDAEMKAMLKRLTSVLSAIERNGVQAKMSYTEWKNKTEKVQAIEAKVSRSQQ
jgi:hypothetical protein